MSYTERNFKSKKDLKEALKAGYTIYCFNPGLGPDLSNYTGSVTLEGPHYPQPHKWYANGMLQNGVLVSVK